MPLAPDVQYAANIAALAENPAMGPLVTQLAQIPLTNCQLGQAPSGHLIGAGWDVTTQAWIPLCDMQHPEAAAEQAVEQMWSRTTTVYTMLGVGMGYAIQAFAKRLLPYQRLVVWDPEGVFFKAMLYAIDITEVFHGKRIEINVGNDILGKIEPWYLTLEVHEKLHMAFPVNHSYTNIYRKAAYQAVLDRCM